MIQISKWQFRQELVWEIVPSLNLYTMLPHHNSIHLGQPVLVRTEICLLSLIVWFKFMLCNPKYLQRQYYVSTSKELLLHCIFLDVARIPTSYRLPTKARVSIQCNVCCGMRIFVSWILKPKLMPKSFGLRYDGYSSIQAWDNVVSTWKRKSGITLEVWKSFEESEFRV